MDLHMPIINGFEVNAFINSDIDRLIDETIERH